MLDHIRPPRSEEGSTVSDFLNVFQGRKCNLKPWTSSQGPVCVPQRGLARSNHWPCAEIACRARNTASAEYNGRMERVSAVDLVGVGLNATDTVIQVGDFPSSGAKVEYSDETVMPGGQVASTVVACRIWGLSTRYIGKLGDDDAARLHQREFEARGVDARLIHVPGAPSPRSLILVDRRGERTVLCRRDERLILQPEELQREWVASARVLHVDGHDTAAATLAAQWAREAGIPVVADLDETYPGVDELIRNIDYLIVSRDFPLRLMRDTDLKRALRGMQGQYGCRLAAATLG